MNRDLNQMLLWSKEDLGLIKAAFNDNEELLYLIRKVFFQYPLTGEEIRKLKAQMTPEVIKILRKLFRLEITDEFPLGFSRDYWYHLATEIRSILPDNLEHILDANRLVVNYLTQQLKGLEVGDFEGGLISFSDLNKVYFPKESYVNLVARSRIIEAVEQYLIQIRVMAENKKETPEELRERLTRNSSK